jgi:hypothetical protein
MKWILQTLFGWLLWGIVLLPWLLLFYGCLISRHHYWAHSTW